MRVLGFVLIVLGVLALIYRGITYTTHKDVISVGPVHASVETKKTIPLPPLFGGLAMAGGIILVVAGSRKK